MKQTRITAHLPDSVLAWARATGWSQLRATVVQGPYEQRVFSIYAQDATGQPVRAVYKRAAERAGGCVSEATAYRTWLTDSGLRDYAPPLYGCVETAAEHGLILADGGDTLADVLAAAAPADRSALLTQAARWLASLHIAAEARSHEWLQRGWLTRYPYALAAHYGGDAARALTSLASDLFPAVSTQVAAQVNDWCTWFYPRLPDWMRGRETLTHGDPHMANLLLRDGRLALIDWEFSAYTVPQRDLAILVQGVADDVEAKLLRSAYTATLRSAGWSVDGTSAVRSWHACLFDNTLMMLGWEIHLYRQGHLAAAQLQSLLTRKLRWLSQSVDGLRG